MIFEKGYRLPTRVAVVVLPEPIMPSIKISRAAHTSQGYDAASGSHGLGAGRHLAREPAGGAGP